MKYELVMELAGSGLTDVKYHFTPRRWYQGIENWTWNMRREGSTVTGLGNYILRSYSDYFTKAGVWEARLHADHQMVLAVLPGGGEWKNHRYRVGRTK